MDFSNIFLSASAIEYTIEKNLMGVIYIDSVRLSFALLYLHNI